MTSGPAFNYLDSAPLRCTGADIPVPYAKSLEELSFPQPFNVVNSVKKVLNIGYLIIYRSLNLQIFPFKSVFHIKEKN